MACMARRQANQYVEHHVLNSSRTAGNGVRGRQWARQCFFFTKWLAGSRRPVVNADALSPCGFVLILSLLIQGTSHLPAGMIYRTYVHSLTTGSFSFCSAFSLHACLHRIRLIVTDLIVHAPQCGRHASAGGLNLTAHRCRPPIAPAVVKMPAQAFGSAHIFRYFP